MTSNAVSEVPFRAWRFPLERVPTNAQARFAYWEEFPSPNCEPDNIW